YKTPDEVHRAF
ncbi:hypothetical protein JTJ03_13750, partial [Vibrio fluvialis]